MLSRNDEEKNIIKNEIKECSNLAAKLSSTPTEGPALQNEAIHKSFQKKCSECGDIFSKNSDFEIHMEEVHHAETHFKCDLCEKTFLLEWRLKRHRDIHTEKPKKCKFFLNKELCPFDRLGCMFAHENIESEIVTVEEEITLKENQCHMCMLEFSSKDNVMDHIENDHADYFEGLMEYAAAIRTDISPDEAE